MSPVTASLVPKHITAGRPRSVHLLQNKEGAEQSVQHKEGAEQRVQSKEGDTATNASIIEQGVLALQSSGEDQIFVQHAVQASQRAHGISCNPQ
jgi:hypothetical protein